MGTAGMRKLKYGKIAIVVSLTVLIWVWADLTLDETPAARTAVIVVDESVDPKLWVSFSQKPSVPIKVTLSGPHSAFVALDHKLPTEGKTIRFVFDPVAEKMTEPPGRPLRVLDFLQKDRELKQLGLKVKLCEPEVVDVNVVELNKRSLPVECFDEDGVPQKAENIDPSKVEMFVPEGTRTARVQLSHAEIERARSTPIPKMPYVVLAEGLIRYAPTPVKVKMPPPTDPLSEETINAPKLGMALSVNLLQGKYSVEITNQDEVRGPIKIRATAPAKQAYEGMRYQIILEIDDEDIKLAEPRRELRYNFPEEFVRTNEIEINQAPVQARFKLKAVSPSSESP